MFNLYLKFKSIINKKLKKIMLKIFELNSKFKIHFEFV